jgi:hypothetical protein
MEESVEYWKEETASLLEDIFGYISDTLEELISNHFASFKDSGLVLVVR